MTVKSLSHLPFEQIVFWRALISLSITFVFLRWRGIPLWGVNRRMLIFRGVAGTLALTLFFYTLHKMPLASAVTIQYLAPIFTVLFSGLFFGEQVRPWHWFCSMVGFVGVLVIQGFDTRVDLLDAGVGVVSAMASAVAYNTVRSLRGADHEWVVIFYFPLIASAITFPLALSKWVWPAGWDWALLVVIGVLTQAAQLYLTKGYQAERAAKIAAVNYVGVLWAVLFGVVIFHETIPAATVAGMILIMLSVWMSTREARRPPTPVS